MSDPNDASSTLVNDATMIADLGGPAASSGGERALFAGRYELLGELGRGGMGVVFKARDTMVGDLVALKTLEISGGASASAVERFRREVRLARKITHPNVARTHDLGDAGGRHYLTMEFVEGTDLASLLQREGRFPATRAVAIAWMVCEGLAAAHAAGVVHRDLKPANIIVETTGRVVLTDFGIARAFADDNAARTVGTIGTLVYMAPEQVTGASSDPRTDVYAVGLLLFEMLTGELAFTGETPLAAAIARLHAEPPDPRSRLPEVPEALAELIMRCLAKSPEGRPGSAKELADALLGWMRSVGKTPEQCAATLQTSMVAAVGAAGVMVRAVTRAGGTEAVNLRPGTSAASTSTLTRRTPADTMGRVAVLPLRVLGGRDFDYFGETLAEGIVDLLGRTHGVEVASPSASARFREDRDPAAVAAALGVAYVVDGTVQVARDQARVSVRLSEVGGGTQLWSGRFSGSLEDPFELQDRLAQQIGEALRSELLSASYRERADEETLELCRDIRARGLTASGPLFDAVISRLERAVERYPDFAPALPLLALLTVRGWFTHSDTGSVTWGDRARAAVERAVREAGDFPETRLAEAMLAVQEGRFRDAVLALRRALGAAPAFPAAIQYLGSMQCEAGQASEGLRRLRLALELSPDQSPGLFELARCSALRGDMKSFHEALERLRELLPTRGPVQLLEMRVAAWRGDRAEVERVVAGAAREPGPIIQAILGYGRAVLGLQPPPTEMIDALLDRPINPRFASMLCQIICEALCLVGEPERGLTYFLRAADSVLIDLEWADRCPALDAMRGLPGFDAGRRKVRERVDDLWGA